MRWLPTFLEGMNLSVLLFLCLCHSWRIINEHESHELHEKNYSNNTTPIDSIVIIYRSIEMAFDDLKITVSPSNSDIRFIKSFFDKLQHKAKPQRLCEWQRKEIFDTLVGIYVTGSIKIGTGKNLHVTHIIQRHQKCM